MHLRVDPDNHDDDVDIAAFVKAATMHVERVTNYVAGIQQTWRQDFDGFCSVMRLPVGPVTAVSSITYKDEAGSPTTVNASDYDLLSDQLGSYVRFKDDYAYPSNLYEVAAVRVTWTAGQEAPPEPLVSAVKLIVGDLYYNREGQIDGSIQENPTVRALLSTYRVF